MKPTTKRRVVLTSRQLLNLFGELVVFSKQYRIPYHVLERYEHELGADRRRLGKTLQYLKARGYIINAVEGKERFIEVSKKALAKIRDERFWENLPKPERWDRKWRMVIFDMPAKWEKSRHKFPNQLKAWGFFPLQRSVYVYPFDCRKEVNTLIQLHKVEKTVIYLVADVIEGEERIANHFVDEHILTKEQVE